MMGGGDLAVVSTGCLHTWPETFAEIPRKFRDQTIVDPKKFMNDSAFRYGHVLFKCLNTTFRLMISGVQIGPVFQQVLVEQCTKHFIPSDCVIPVMM